ncbi:MAG: ATP-dependent helicase [Gemmatimonadetes bacterium]|nr:ATP-dependent helicase [Gemmatimonadota bacterium]
MSDSALYLRAARDLEGNDRQWEAYESTSHCVVLAGPGSGKTKILTIKLARMLVEDVHAPRGIACITYNNECARELESRLDALGVESRGRVFIGTVHSFALTQIILPYAKTARIDIPDPFRVATRAQEKAAFEAGFANTIGGAGDPEPLRRAMGRYRRAILDRRSPSWRETDPQNAQLAEAYEQELRHGGLIDFDDMPLLALDALKGNVWLRGAILAKYPVLVVDEYQDLGHALHQMVMGLCFQTGVRLFAVGDVDQSIYGFTGAYPALLERVAGRAAVQTVRLRLNYRCSLRIVAAARYALGEDRGYQAADGAVEGAVAFHAGRFSYEEQAMHLFSAILPKAYERMPDLTPGRIAVLYQAAWIGDLVANEAKRLGIDVVRTDVNALYPRNSRLMRWLEDCAAWCCQGWHTATPRFSTIVNGGTRIFAEAIHSEDDLRAFQRRLASSLWALRDPSITLYNWLERMREDVLQELADACQTLDEDWAILRRIVGRTSDDEELAAMTVSQFFGVGDGGDRLNLSTLHSSKGREFDVVVLFGMDNGRVPRHNATRAGVLEARRLFYVGFTRAKREVHIMYSQSKMSPFVSELRARLSTAE